MKTSPLKFFCVVFAALSAVGEAGRRRRTQDSRRRSDEIRRRASEKKANEMKTCWTNTGGTCNVLGCKAWRGNTTCFNYLCMCEKGYCSDRDGACQKDTGAKTLVKEGVLIRSVYDPKYVLYVDGCGDPQDNNKIDIEEGYLKVRENFDGKESRFDIHQTLATKDGKRGYLLVSQAFPNCVATLGLVKACVNVNGDDNDESNCDNHIRGVNEPFEALWEGWKGGPWAAAMAFEKDGSYKLRSLRWTSFYMGMSRVGWVVQNMIETFNSDRVRWTFDPPMDSELDVFNVSAQQEEIDFV